MRFLQGWEMFIRHSASADEVYPRAQTSQAMLRLGYLHFITSSVMQVLKQNFARKLLQRVRARADPTQKATLG